MVHTEAIMQSAEATEKHQPVQPMNFANFRLSPNFPRWPLYEEGDACTARKQPSHRGKCGRCKPALFSFPLSSGKRTRYEIQFERSGDENERRGKEKRKVEAVLQNLGTGGLRSGTTSGAFGKQTKRLAHFPSHRVLGQSFSELLTSVSRMSCRGGTELHAVTSAYASASTSNDRSTRTASIIVVTAFWSFGCTCSPRENL
ncbi:hypothetical protein MPTK1_7g14480 [Marchantia polymorpha subsp. ruderalis]|uniref:Uncharacterized protein n=2 Tax=Marchantia polymorpha TaxID=3197 RepID=A0AAF6BZK1_MARPO|nr:hypothetical protein MARPO_0009s0133 [Marchantia polymorpha]BBN17435.1 hypothetical protein Mp_7g14480 [Marchantia polymorpha subsp. ruderalis]|eukprot:PTQ47038.1 hypothetical protein MARPO_0009s0133 [Marchantia polymorpha]